MKRVFVSAVGGAFLLIARPLFSSPDIEAVAAEPDSVCQTTLDGFRNLNADTLDDIEEATRSGKDVMSVPTPQQVADIIKKYPSIKRMTDEAKRMSDECQMPQIDAVATEARDNIIRALLAKVYDQPPIS